MKKAKKKVISGLAICAVTILTALSVSAYSYYTSTLSLGSGYHLDGAVRNYTAGTFVIQILIDSWTNYDNLGYTKLQTQLRSGNHTHYKTENTVNWKITDSTVGNQVWDSWSNKGAGDYYYYFSTKIGGVTYGGVESSKVTMISQ